MMRRMTGSGGARRRRAGRRATPLLALTVAGALWLTGCSGSDESDGGGAGGGSSSASPYLPVPDGVDLTAQGSQLKVGDRAVVAYHPRQGQVAALDVRVTALQRTSIEALSAFQLNPQQQSSTPFYVRATIKNVGDTDLGGRPVPLYGLDDQNVLLESTPFLSSFDPCPSTPFPDEFRPGSTAKVCLVYLAPDHGHLDGASFRPEETFDPITWTGKVEKYQPAGSGKSGKKPAKGGKG
jgi:hypothetical protein